MKLVIVALTTLLAAICAAQAPEAKVISPDFLFPIAWEHHNALQTMQDEITLKIREAITAISDVLDASTDQTLHQYENVVDGVEEIYAPAIEQFKTLKDAACRGNAETILNSTTVFTGFSISNCASAYDTRVKTAVDNANKALVKVDDVYSQISTIVTKAFVKQNAFVDPETIRDNIEEIFGHVKAKWDASKPELEAVKLTLAAAVAAQNIELGNCHIKIHTDILPQFSMFSSMVQACVDFDNTVEPFSIRARMGRLSPTPTAQLQILEEFETLFAKLQLQPYEWQA